MVKVGESTFEWPSYFQADLRSLHGSSFERFNMFQALSCTNNIAKPLWSESGTHKTVKAEFWPWLEPFSVRMSSFLLSCTLLARKRASLGRWMRGRSASTGFPNPKSETLNQPHCPLQSASSKPQTLNPQPRFRVQGWSWSS